MNDYSVVKYSSVHYNEWNAFVEKAKNATFLFHRDFMEYHQDRFEDYSLLVYEKDRLVALLPANIKEKTIYSHQGLSYGGLIFKGDLKFSKVLQVFKKLLEYLNFQKFKTLDVKIIPSIYCHLPSDEMHYMMYLLEAELVKSESLSTIFKKANIKFSKDRIDGAKRGVKNGLIIKEDADFEDFWNTILIPNLKEKHKVKPVHSLDEIIYLKGKFPNNIKQYNVYYDGQIVAGTTVFISPNVVHSQYISGNSLNNQLGSLDFLHEFLIKSVFKDKDYFDLGNSNVSNGKQVNKSLQYWKEGFGARTVVQDFYRINTANFSFLQTVFV